MLVARIPPHESARGVEDFERDGTARIGPEPIVDDGAVGRIRSRRLVGRQRRVGVHVEADAIRRRGREQMRVALLDSVDLPKRRDGVENPEAAPVRRDRDVVVLDDQIAHRRRRKIQPQRLPVFAVVEGRVHAAFGGGVQQSLFLRIFADRVRVLVRRDSAGDRRPGLAAVVRPIDVRTQVVEPQRVDRRIRGERVEMARVDERHLRPRRLRLLGRGHVLPMQSAVRRHVDQPVVGARPDDGDIEGRGRQGVNDAALRGPRRVGAGVLADIRRNVPRLSCQVLADLLPAHAAVDRFPDDVVRINEQMRIGFRKHHRLCSDDAERAAASSAGRRTDVLHLSRPPVEAGDLPAAEHDVGVQRIRRGVAIFIDADRMPFAEGDLAVAAAARHAG